MPREASVYKEVSSTRATKRDVPEIVESLLKSSVKAILVKGEPGVGKTTFSLELLETYGRGIYVSTRVSQEKITEQHPGMAHLMRSGKVRQMSLTEPAARFEDFRLATAGQVLEALMNIVHEIKEPLIVLDAWDALAKELDLVERLRTEKSMMAIAEANGARLLFVGEEPTQTTTDYLVDAVLELRDDIFEGRRIRRIIWKKIRGSTIPSRSSAYTLLRGRIMLLKGARVLRPSDYKPTTYRPLKHNQENYSTGSRDLDRFLGGGIPKGSMILLEFGQNIGWSWHLPMLTSIICNFIANGGSAVVSVPSANVTPQDILTDVLAHLPRKEVEPVLRLGSQETSDEVCYYKTDPRIISRTYHATQRAMREVKGDSNRPCFRYVGSETLEYIYGPDEPVKYSVMVTQQLQRSGDSMIRSVGHATKAKEIFSTLANTHLKLDVIDGAMVLYSVKPPSELYNLVYEYDEGFPRVRLVPVV
jgi:KaiC/GvpD/RAD55 family RecA-like ATPase